MIDIMAVIGLIFTAAIAAAAGWTFRPPYAPTRPRPAGVRLLVVMFLIDGIYALVVILMQEAK